MSAPPFVRRASQYNATRGLIARLFEGITLTDAQETQARQVVSAAIDAQLAVTLRNAEGWERLHQIAIARDASLRELLDSDHDRSIFDRHSAELRRRQAEAAPTPNAPVVLRVGVVPILGGTLEIVFRADGMTGDVMERASWQLVQAFRGDADQLGVYRMSIIADLLERRDEFATYSRSVTRAFGRQPDGVWVPLPAV